MAKFICGQCGDGVCCELCDACGGCEGGCECREFIETVRVDGNVIADVYRLSGQEAVAVLTRWDVEQEAWHTAMTSALDAANHPW